MTAFDSSTFLTHCPTWPGVYRMWDAREQLLYVGKAINLKKRLASYFRSTGLAPKTAALVARIARIDTTITRNETEALLLEQNLIKQHRPPYNILLRDDKSYPCIYLSTGDYPGLFIHRGAKKRPGRYFGPYPSSGAVRETLHLLQKTFQVRQCEDSVFRNRTRPCLQYQIKRCKAPCVHLVTPQQYAQDVQHSVLFLEGRSNQLTEELSQRMEQLAATLAFEEAAHLRDQIIQLRHVQHQQDMESTSGNADVLAIDLEAGIACINLISIRDGRVLGDRNFFPSFHMDESAADILRAFLEQYYLGSGEHDLPDELILGMTHSGFPAISEAIYQVTGRKIHITTHGRGIRARWLESAQTNAHHALMTKHHSRQQRTMRLAALAEALQLSSVPKRLECFDISHHSGEATVASCVVFGPDGPIKSDYRCYAISHITPGDDYAALEQALQKRFNGSTDAEKWPDLLLIDGGKGQLNAVRGCLERLGYASIKLLGIAKGPSRKPGLETLYLDDSKHEFHLAPDSAALHLIQQIRDEAHRFAITGNRTRVHKARRSSQLEHIKGIGPKRRQELLRYFGGLQGLKNASINEMTRVSGINNRLAELIYTTLHSE